MCWQLCNSYIMEYSFGNKPSKKMIDQFRSWSIMKEYFNIERDGVTSVVINFNWREELEPELVKSLDSLIKKSKDRWEEIAKLN